MVGFFKTHVWLILTALCVLFYIGYFSYFTVLRYQTLYASYFDLGIMHQTVFNTFKSIAHLDISRFLELTNPFSTEQIKRMAIHNDLTLALFSLFYFINASQNTLLILQSVILGCGAFVMFAIARVIFKKSHYASFLSFVFSFSYLLYTPMERANIFDFHAVTLATPFLLAMIYFWLVKKYKISFLFFLLSLFSKEQVSLTLIYFSLYVLWYQWKSRIKVKTELQFGLVILGLSIGWFLLSMFVIIPQFRGSHPFALQYYGDFGDSPFKILLGILHYPLNVFKYLWRWDTVRYFWFLLGPLGLTSLLSPVQLLISLPEFAINLFSNNWNMRNIIFHYTAVIQPFVFFSALYGTRNLIKKFHRPLLIGLYIVGSTLLFSYFKSPLPYSREKDIHPLRYPQPEQKEVHEWQTILRDERLKIASTGQLAPLFTSRQFFYTFSSSYYLADYIVIRRSEIYNYPEKNMLIPAYEHLIQDARFQQIYKNNNLEVYKKISYDLNNNSRL